MHKDMVALNKKDPPPKGYVHPAYEVVNNRYGGFTVAYLLNGKWNMCTKVFQSERAAFSFILDKLYYGE